MRAEERAKKADALREKRRQRKLEETERVAAEERIASALRAEREFSPPAECRRCGEGLWEFVELSPSAKSAKWQCRYCEKLVVVTRDEGCRREAKPSRDAIPREVQREVWRRDGGRCVVCGSQERLEFDHTIPLSKGGANTARNIQLLCERCNRTKGGKAPGH